MSAVCSAARSVGGMGRKITRHRNEDLPASVSAVPLGELPDSRLQHLIGMDACIFAQTARASVSISSCGGWPSLRCRATSGPRDRPVAAGRRRRARRRGLFQPWWQVVALLAALARNASRRHIEITSKIERHRSVHEPAALTPSYSGVISALRASTVKPTRFKNSWFFVGTGRP
jgi:hypothetical protein